MIFTTLHTSNPAPPHTTHIRNQILKCAWKWWKIHVLDMWHGAWPQDVPCVGILYLHVYLQSSGRYEYMFLVSLSSSPFLPFFILLHTHTHTCHFICGCTPIFRVKMSCLIWVSIGVTPMGIGLKRPSLFLPL